MKNRVVSYLTTLAYTLVAFIIIAIVANDGKGSFEGLLWFTIFIAPAIHYYRLNKRAKVADKKWIDTFISSLNIADKRFIHAEDKTGIAVDDAKFELILANDDITKRYSFSDVRSWEIKSVMPDVWTGGSAAANMGRNIAAHKNAIRGTGLFIQMKDIDHPEWRIAMLQDQDRKRWFEILNQKING